jgi:hypothetical protein
MAAFLETTRITNLCMGLARALPGEEVSQRYLTIHPFAFQMIVKPGLIMTFRTRHVFMAGSPPRLHIVIHLVAEATKGGAFREFKKGKRENQECNDANNKRSLYCPGVVLSSFFKTQKNINPESFY